MPTAKIKEYKMSKHKKTVRSHLICTRNLSEIPEHWARKSLDFRKENTVTTDFPV